jgi:FKBP-type peptidyl-prolyl cis-trans isomerase FkpA
MSRHSIAFRTRVGAIVAATAFGVVGLAGCGSLVTVSSHITPIPPNCTSPRSSAAIDSFSTPVTLQQGASGLQFGDISVGCGKVASATATANVQFTVWLQDGTQVATTRGAGQPTNPLALGNSQTLAFWRAGVPGMRVGGTRKLVVPPALGFGPGGNSSAGVPPNTTLIVDVELVSLG